MANAKYTERHREIHAILLADRKILVEDLSQRFNVSEVTIRKDLTEMESRGILLRTHGGAVLAERPDGVIPLQQRALDHPREKELIARAASHRIRDGESILIDTGSTTLALARLLHGRNLSVVTNSMAVAHELASDENISLTVLGGTLRRSVLSLVVASPNDQLRHLHVDRAFMGASGFDLVTGFACQNMIEAETKQAMLRTAQEVIMLVDSGKFTLSEIAPFCSLKQVHCVITEAPPPKGAADALKKAGISTVIANQLGGPAK